jgi:hypothetical protein
MDGDHNVPSLLLTASSHIHDTFFYVYDSTAEYWWTGCPVFERCKDREKVINLFRLSSP